MASADCNDVETRHENSCSRCECNVCADPKRFRPQLASCSGPYSCAPVSPDWDYMVSGVPNRTKEGEPRIVTEVLYNLSVRQSCLSVCQSVTLSFGQSVSQFVCVSQKHLYLLIIYAVLLLMKTLWRPILKRCACFHTDSLR